MPIFTDEPNTDLFKMTCDMAYDGMICITEAERIVYCNQSFCDIFGYTKMELIGQQLDILIPTMLKKKHHHQVSSFISKSHGRLMGTGREITGRHKNGRSISLEIGINSINYLGTPAAIAIVRDTSERKKIEKKLQHYAYYDQLTGLANRTYFNKKIEESFERAKRYKVPFSIMFLDLNKFKAVNDQYGHKYGDQVLVQSAKRIKKLLRKTDLAARLGGDEFIILLDALEHKEDCQLVALRIIETIGKPYTVYSKRLHIGVSIGIATYNPSVENADTLVKQADDAMYQAKLKTKNHYAFFSPSATGVKKQIIK